MNVVARGVPGILNYRGSKIVSRFNAQINKYTLT